jgi:hypothetical protein
MVKFADPTRWLFTDEALQQATAEPVATHRARRLAGLRVHDATCSIGTELAALRDSSPLVVGSDVDPVRLAMARHNVDGVALCRADALAPVTRGTVVLVDPARRSKGRRRSLTGSVREACLWSAGLAGDGVTRRATMLDSGEEITDAEPDDSPVAAVGRWIIDPDGAVVRAGLVKQYATRHGLWQLDPDIAYLSGDRLPEAVRGFEVLEELSYSERRLRQALSARDVGAVEILVRGVDVDPDALRSRMRLRGSQQVSVVIARIGSGRASRATAFICRPTY